MMKNNTFNTIDEQDDFILSMDISQLREMEKNSLFVLKTEKSLVVETNEYAEIDEYIQNLQLSELKEIERNGLILDKINEQSILHKSKLTGLDKNTIILIETRKEKATLEQLITYCSKLHIPFQKLAPELYFLYR